MEKDISANNVALIRKYDRSMIGESLAKATRHKHLQIILNLSVFKKFIGSDMKSFSIIDGDIRSNEQTNDIRKKIEEKGVKAHIWNKCEIENYLLIPSLMERLINDELKSRKDDGEISNMKDLIFNAAGELQDYVIGQYLEKLQDWVRKSGGKMDPSTAYQNSKESIGKVWNDWEQRVSLAPGKEILKKVNDKINTIYGIYLTPSKLSASMKKDEIHPEIIATLKEISAL